MLNRVEMVIVDILFPKLKEREDIQYLTLLMSLAVYFLYVLFIRSRMLLSTPSFLWVLLMNMGWILSNAFLYILQWHYFPFLLMKWIKLSFIVWFFFFNVSWPCIPWINLIQSWFIILFIFTGFNLLILCLRIHIYFHKRYKPLILPPFNVIFRFWCWDYIGLMKQELLSLFGIS